MISQKSCIENPHGGGWFSRELKLLPVFFGLIFSFNFSFSDNTSALFVPTLSASIDQANLQVNGNQVINSADKTTEIPFGFTVNTNNRTGYTATLSAETENTSLTNTSSTTSVKINSISSAGLLGDFSNNTWGYKFGTSANYAPIPALSTPTQILQTTGKTNGDESSQLSIGMKLTENLESGNYTNKLILSFVSNPYTPKAIMTEGPDFNTKLKSLETTTNKIEHFKKSTVAPAISMNVVNIEDKASDCEIKLWLDSADKTAYYYTEPEKVYLNGDSSMMFYSYWGDDKLKGILDIDLSNFDTSQVTNMSGMFSGMRNLTTLDLSNFDTSKVTDMSFMFGSMSNLTTLDLSNFNTSKATNMSEMFLGMANLTSLNLSSFDTSKVTSMRFMFFGISSLTVLNLSSFDTSQVTDMSDMFRDMSSLTTLDLSSFDTSKVTNMGGMFCNVFNLTTLDLSNFDTSKVTSMSLMFCLDNKYISKDKLETIYVKNDFNTARLIDTYALFGNRKKLRGGNGSYLTNPSTADETWLRVDRPGVHGYFTRKS